MSEPLKLEKARAAVIKAAKEWVNFEDSGLPEALPVQVRINERLVAAVSKLEKVERELEPANV